MTGALPALEMRGIRKTFPGVVALDDVDLTLETGDVHMLLGENGAGKSTLMKILSGAYRRDAGSIAVRGEAVEIASPRDALALGIRVIYQEPSLVPQLSVAENIFLGALPTFSWRVRKDAPYTQADGAGTRRCRPGPFGPGFGIVDRRELRAQTTRLLADLGLNLDPSIQVAQLGLAQRQMVEIAKSLSAGEGRILVMDEPTSSLTTREVSMLFELIERLSSRGVAIVYITHRLDEVFCIGRRLTVLRDGRRVTTRPVGDVTVAELVQLMANRNLTEHFPKVPAPRGAELLRVEHLTSAGKLFDVSFSLHAGEVLGVAGLVGAGRTELARAVSGADRFQKGRLILDGGEVSFRQPADAIARGVGLLPEDRKADGLVSGLTVARNVALPHGRRLARFGVVPPGAEMKLSKPIADDLRVKAAPGQPVRLLSGGNQQKVVLGKWLAGDVRVFVFDEPTRGVDVGSKVEIYNLMNRLAARGAGILMISSELPELVGMSDRVIVMHRGRIHAQFDRGAATEERVLAAALGLNH
jgi:ribose transport system ATP-binding protein